jgi:hypothetical protein
VKHEMLIHTFAELRRPSKQLSDSPTRGDACSLSSERTKSGQSARWRHPGPRWFAWVAMLSLWALACWARPASAAPADPSRPVPVISVLTFGPGTETFSKFGHDALWVHDASQPPGRRDTVFNYGTFRFDSPWLIVDFLKGKLSYWLSQSSLERTLAAYRAANRSVSAQVLDLEPDTARGIAAALYENVKPENASYRYDYYRDNCATRIRDLLDNHLGHRLLEASRGPAPLTWREHTRRLTIDSPVLYFALDLALGPLIDRSRSQWEDMFLPSRVEAKLAELLTSTGTPLVKQKRVLFEARRPPVLETAPSFRWSWLLLGLCIGGSLYALSRARSRGARFGLAAGIGATSAAIGVLGVLLLVLWLFTDHDVTYWNHNVLLCPPWALGIAALAVGFAREQPRRARLMMQLVAAAVVSASFAGLLGLVVPGHQQNGPALSLFLPIWFGMAGAVWERCGRPVSLLAPRLPSAEPTRAPSGS